MSNDVEATTITAQRVQSLDAQAMRPHPLLDPKFPFTVEIHVKDSSGEFKKREGIVKGNDYHVTLQNGEVYEIHIIDRSTRGAFMRLLVDGLNTLPQRKNISNKGISVELVTDGSKWIVAPRVNLAEARAWYLDPATVDANGKIIPKSYGISFF